MRSSSLWSVLLYSALAAACAHDDHDDRVWSKEELAELEAKWGHEVSISILTGSQKTLVLEVANWI